MTGEGWIQEPLWETMCYPPLHTGTDFPISRFLSLLHCRALSIPEKHLFWHRKRIGLIIPSMPNFPPTEGMKGEIQSSPDPGWTGKWIYKISAYTESIKLILQMMPTYTINHQMIIGGGKVFKHPFLESLFSFSLSKLISISLSLSLFKQIGTHTKPSQDEDFCKPFQRAGLWLGKAKDTRQPFKSLGFTSVQSEAFPTLHSDLNFTLRVTALLWIPSLRRYVLPPWCYLNSFLLTLRQWTVLL